MVTFINKNFFALDDKTLKSFEPINFAWTAARTPADDVQFVTTLQKHITSGGYLCLHEPTMITTTTHDGMQKIGRVTPLSEKKFSIDLIARMRL